MQNLCSLATPYPSRHVFIHSHFTFCAQSLRFWCEKYCPKTAFGLLLEILSGGDSWREAYQSNVIIFPVASAWIILFSKLKHPTLILLNSNICDYSYKPIDSFFGFFFHNVSFLRHNASALLFRSWPHCNNE